MSHVLNYSPVAEIEKEFAEIYRIANIQGIQG